MSRTDRSALVTATEAARDLGIDPHLIYVWVADGKFAAAARRGRSPLYRYGEIVDVERETRLTWNSSRNEERVRRRMLASV